MEYLLLTITLPISPPQYAPPLTRQRNSLACSSVVWRSGRGGGRGRPEDLHAGADEPLAQLGVDDVGGVISQFGEVPDGEGRIGVVLPAPLITQAPQGVGVLDVVDLIEHERLGMVQPDEAQQRCDDSDDAVAGTRRRAAESGCPFPARQRSFPAAPPRRAVAANRARRGARRLPCRKCARAGSP